MLALFAVVMAVRSSTALLVIVLLVTAFPVTEFGVGPVRVVGIMFIMIVLTMIIVFALGCGCCRFLALMPVRLRCRGICRSCCRKTCHQNNSQRSVHVYHSRLIR